ncbi:MAG: choice-of-anchor B family protein [Planctomycetota bacterium]
MRFATVPLVAACLLTPFTSALAQTSRNVQLLGTFSPGDRASDVWGYYDPTTGTELALLGTFAGTYIVDCTDPTQPTEIALIPTDSPFSSGNRWQDLKTYDTYAYVVSEAYGGVQIIDLSDPMQPTKVRTWGASMWFNAHNIAIDVGAGFAYVCGTSSGTHILDLRTNPANPTLVTTLSTPYIHDLSIQDGMAHVAEINSNRLSLYDVSGLPSLPQVSSVRSAGSASCHSTWPSRDNQIVAVCHETSGGQLVVYDVSVPRLPRVLSIYQTGGSSAIVHNPMVQHRVVHISWNTEGYQALDLSNPSNPIRVGFYDTWPGPSSGFNGMWGVFVGQPSGVVYGSDRDLGLFVLDPACQPSRYGGPSAGSATPELWAFGAAWNGNGNFRIDIEDAPTQQPGVLLLSAAPADLTFRGLRILVDLTAPNLAIPIATDASGMAQVPLPIAEGTGTGTLYAQGFVADGAGPFGFSATGGLAFDVFLP